MDALRPYVLVVDDLPDAADALAGLLTLWGYEAEPHHGAAAALGAALARPPDAVLLDLLMPGMGGFEFAERFRQLRGCAGRPVVAVTGYATPASYARARDLGIEHYLLKPADLDTLKELLARLARRGQDPSDGVAGPARPAGPGRAQMGVGVAAKPDRPAGGRATFPPGSGVVELALLLPADQVCALEAAACRSDLTAGQLARRVMTDFLRRIPPGVGWAGEAN